MPNLGLLFAILYGCVVIGVVLFLLVLLSRFVKAHERIAAALEGAAANLQRNDR